LISERGAKKKGASHSNPIREEAQAASYQKGKKKNHRSIRRQALRKGKKRKSSKKRKKNGEVPLELM